MNGTNEIVLFQPDEAMHLEVLLNEDTVWLTQAQMVELFKGKVYVKQADIKNE
jgi:hypothetical protein